MNTKHPFKWIKKKSQFPVFLVSFLATILIIVVMQILGKPLVTKSAPAGIISFEFAGDLETAQSIVTSWEQDSLIYAGLNLGFDYLFMIGYGITIGLGSILIAQRFQPKNISLSRMGYLLAWGSTLAALLDALENYALIRVLLGSANDIWPVIARWGATVKFFLVAIGIIYILSGVLYLLISKNKQA